MNSSQTQTQIDQYQKDISLKLDLLKDIDLSTYPLHRLHFLVYALQKGIKLPSESSMKRTEMRNYKKIGAIYANSILKRINSIFPSQKFRTFYLPNKYGSKLISSCRPRVMIGGRLQRIKFRHFYRPAHVVIKKSISLPSQIKAKPVAQKNRKAKIKAFRSKSPHWILSKARRESFIRQILNHNKLQGLKLEKNGFSQVSKKNKIPAYFKKKKANQKRRRRQKHLLIQSNRTALVQIFGNAIFSKGWPVSRKQIKLALGIKEEDHMKPQFLGQFMEMVQRRNKNLPKTENQVSRMVRRIDISKKNNKENFDSQKKTSSSVLFFPDMKLKRVIYRPKEEQFPSLFDSDGKKGQKQ